MGLVQTSTGALIGIEIGKYQGESFDDLVLLIYEADGVTPADLSDVFLHASVRYGPTVEPALVDMTNEDYGIVVIAPGQIILPALTAEVSAGWLPTVLTPKPLPLTWDHFCEFADGSRRLTHAGTITVFAANTRYP